LHEDPVINPGRILQPWRPIDSSEITPERLSDGGPGSVADSKRVWFVIGNCQTQNVGLTDQKLAMKVGRWRKE